MKKLVDVQVEFHHWILKLRGIETIILKPLFCRLWDSSNVKDKQQVLKIIKKGDKDELNQWIYTHPDLELGEMSSRKLRELSRNLKVNNYCRLNKPELIASIEEREKQDGKK